MRIPSGTTDRYVYFVAVDATDLKTRETGLTTFTVYASRNGGAAAAFTTPTVNETDTTNMPGVYELLLDEQTTLTAGNDTEELCLHITQASMAPVTRVIELYRPETTEGNTLDVTATGAGGIDWGNIENKTTVNDLSATDIQLVDTVTTYTGNTPQTGDSYAVVNSGTFGNAQLVRSTTPANTLDVSATGEAGIDWNNVGTPGATVDLSATSINLCDTVTTTTTATNLTNAPTNGDLTATMKTSVNTEVVDVLKTDTISEQAQGAPPTTPTFEQAVMYLYMALRNKVDVDSALKEFYNNAGTVIWKKALADDGTNYNEGTGQTGP